MFSGMSSSGMNSSGMSSSGNSGSTTSVVSILDGLKAARPSGSEGLEQIW